MLRTLARHWLKPLPLQPANRLYACAVAIALLHPRPFCEERDPNRGGSGRKHVFGPNDKSDVVSQAIYGSNVTLLGRVENGRRSKPPTTTRAGLPAATFAWFKAEGYATSGPTVQVESLFANIYNEATSPATNPDYHSL